jgi:hypothetical protein
MNDTVTRYHGEWLRLIDGMWGTSASTWDACGGRWVADGGRCENGRLHLFCRGIWVFWSFWVALVEVNRKTSAEGTVAANGGLGRAWPECPSMALTVR